LRLDDFVLFLDENLDNCKPILESLAEQNVRVERYRAHFQPGSADEVWLAFVGERSWVVLTKDKKNRYNEWEKLAIRRQKVTEFYFGSGNMSAVEMAAALVIALPEIRRICRSEAPPLIGSVSRSGKITIVEDSSGSTHERRHRKTRKN
jgi:PIN like domain